ncbi:asparagine--tRNA ligase, partial [Candidatus Bathyarchaeota archaeon]|nr:asparagine--tRNA ligase [Candidatus Bathyarchaeota archaeon]
MPMSIAAIHDVLDEKREGESVTIRGWIYRKRESKKTIFLIVRDASGIIQCTVKTDNPLWTQAEKITIESSVMITGTVKQDKRAPGGYEIAVEKLSIIGLAETFPITQDKSEEFLRDVRHLWLRSRRMSLIMKVRSEVLRFTHGFFRKEGFIEVS